MRPFAKYLQDFGIVAQYTMFGTGVAERNRTLMDTVRTVMTKNNLSIWLRDRALRVKIIV